MTTRVSCRACGAEPRTGARFCDSCGSALVVDQPAEYKQVTVLFADVVHSMDIAAAVGAERLREIMTDLIREASAVVQRYGGTVSQFTGDGLMAVFGAPIALEDHAFRACLAALDIQQGVQHLGVIVERRDGIELKLRIGLNSGEVIAGEMGSGPNSYTTIGEQVGMAQRMESVAPAGGVMLSESTARMVGDAVTLGDPQKVRIKGADAPVVARRLLATAPTTQRPARQLSTLVGRGWELTSVNAMLDQSMKGKGRIVGLVGPPGIGKSRMAGEIASVAEGRSCRVFTTRCESHAKEIPFHAAAGLLRDVFAISGLDAAAARAVVRGRMRAADSDDLVLLDDLLGIHDDETPLPAIEPDARGRRLAALLNAAAVDGSTPAVYVVEDAHWIDSVSEAMIAQFAAVVPQTRAMLLLTYRPEYVGVLNQLSGAHRIALAPLDDSESAQLAAELCGSDSTVRSLITQVAARAAGNPFFAEEMVRDLAERGVLKGELGDYVLHGDAGEVSVPASLQATIAARIDRLRPAAKRTLAAASVIGSQFDTVLLEHLVDDIDVAELTAAELIDQVTFTANTEYMFRHPLIRTVAYESQLKADRAELHRQVATVIEARDPEAPGPSAALIAQHLEAAGDLRAAFDWHMRAAAWAQFRDFRAARTAWQQAREVADRLRPDDPEKPFLQIGPRTALCASTFRFSGSVEDTGFEELRDLCASVGDNLSLALGMGGLLTALVFHNRLRDAAQVASDCSAMLDSISEPALTLTLCVAASNAKWQAGEVVEALRLAQRAIDLAEGDPTRDSVVIGSPLTMALALRGGNRLALGIEGWRDDLHRAAQMAISIDVTTHVSGILLKYGYPVVNAASLPGAAAAAETAEALMLAERCGDDSALDMARLARGIALVRGDAAQRSVGLELLTLYREASLRHGYATDAVRFASTEFAKEKARIGDIDGAVQMARSAVDFCFDSGDMTSRGPAVATLVELLLRRGGQGDLGEAGKAVERLTAVPVDPGFVLHELPLLRMRALLARAHSDEAGYRGFADRYRNMANALGFEGHIAIAATMT